MRNPNIHLLQHILTHLPCGICQVILDEDLTISFANNTFYELLGYVNADKEEPPILNYKSFIYPQDYSDLKTCISFHAGNIDRNFAFEHRLLTINQELKWISFHASFDPDAEDSLLCVIIDITEQQNLLEQVHTSSVKHRNTLPERTNNVNLFDISTKTLYQAPEIAREFSLPNIIHNVPDCIVDMGYIAKDSVTHYLDFYRCITEGIPASETVVKICHPESGCKWLKIMYSLLDTPDTPSSRALISYEDVSLQHEKELAYQKWMQSFQEQKEDSLGYYEYNLTKNRFVSVIGIDSSKLPSAVKDSYTDAINYILLHFIPDNGKQAFYKIFGREHLLRRYADEECSFRHETQALNENGSLYWVSVTVQILPDPFTDDLMLFVLLKNIDTEKRKSLSIQKLSEQDSMTGLYNRASFVKHVSQKLNEQPDLHHALIMIDIDHFKKLNDTHGHQFGDSVIMHLTSTLRSTFRKGDYCGRLGGDEFIVFLYDIPFRGLLPPKLQELCSLLKKTYPNGAETSCSLGCAIYPEDGTDFQTLYHHADLALYQVKKKKRGTYAFFQI